MYLKGLKHLGMSLLGPLVCKRRFAAARSTQESASKQSYFAQTLLLLLCFQRATASSTGLYEENRHRRSWPHPFHAAFLSPQCELLAPSTTPPPLPPTSKGDSPSMTDNQGTIRLGSAVMRSF